MERAEDRATGGILANDFGTEPSHTGPSCPEGHSGCGSPTVALTESGCRGPLWVSRGNEGLAGRSCHALYGVVFDSGTKLGADKARQATQSVLLAILVGGHSMTAVGVESEVRECSATLVAHKAVSGFFEHAVAAVAVWVAQLHGEGSVSAVGDFCRSGFVHFDCARWGSARVGWHVPGGVGSYLWIRPLLRKAPEGLAIIDCAEAIVFRSGRLLNSAWRTDSKHSDGR